jgi:hypothetical protein
MSRSRKDNRYTPTSVQQQERRRARKRAHERWIRTGNAKHLRTLANIPRGGPALDILVEVTA